MNIFKRISAYVGGLIAVAAPSAYAAVPASVTQAFTDLTADFNTIFGLGFGVLVVVVVAMLSWRYFKKLGSKV